MTEPIDTAAVRELAGKCPTGEWSAAPMEGLPGHCFAAQVFSADGSALVEVESKRGQEEASSIATFIAQARTLVPDMANEIDGLRFDLSTEGTLRSDADKAILELRASLADKDRLLGELTKVAAICVAAGEMGAAIPVELLRNALEPILSKLKEQSNG